MWRGAAAAAPALRCGALFRGAAAPARGLRASAASLGGSHGDDHTLEPPLYRLPLPSGPVRGGKGGGGGGTGPAPRARAPPPPPPPPPPPQLPEEHELIWHDGVAPEACLDLDAPHMSSTQGLLMWLGGLGFFAAVFLAVSTLDHPANKKSGPREMPLESLHKSLGGYGRT
jgi:hypothetical protein